MTRSCFIIAEAGVNHNGSLSMAKELIDAASEAGADAVKFQTFQADELVSKNAEKAQYQKKNSSGGSKQYEMLKQLELSNEMHEEIIKHCEESGIMFLSTPFDLPSLTYLSERVSAIKIPSGEITNAPFLYEIGRKQLPVILSTGMSNIGEVEQALGALALGYIGGPIHRNADTLAQAAYGEGRVQLEKYVTLLHCTTEYPAPIKDVNLMAMVTMKEAFGLPVGYSDHTEGISVSIAAAALGATVIEKHFTLDRSLPGPDHSASLEPSELISLVTAIRQVTDAMGSGFKAPSAKELQNRAAVRKSLVAGRPIRKGEVFTEDNLRIKRPGSGISPIYYWEYLGTRANRDYETDDLIQ